MQAVPNIKQVLSEVLTLLFSSGQKNAIKKALQILIDFFDVDWIYIASFDNKHHTANFLYEVTSPWVNTSKEDASELSYETIPWMIDTLIVGKDIILSDMSEVPADARDRQLFEDQGLLSMLVIPLNFHKEIQGFIGFDSVRVRRQWTRAEVEDLHIIANIFPIVIERLHTQQEVEEEKRKSELEVQKIKEADKLKSAFLANMSHEIRTPLNAIVGFSNIIAETENIEERRQFQEIINKNNDLLLQLFSDILDFATIESGTQAFKMRRVNLKEICSEIAILCKNKATPGTQFIFQPELHSDLTICTDAQRVIQILMNLISNAFKFTPKGSVTLSYRIFKKQVRIYISDTGIGIAPEHQDKIFQRFSKLDKFSQGTGLGLPICKTIASALNGDIGLSSKPGKGSIFWLQLPLHFSNSSDLPHSIVQPP